MFSRRTDIATGSEQFDARAHMSPGVFRQVREKTTLGFFTGTVPLDKPAGKQGPKDLPLLSPATSTAVVKEVHIQIILLLRQLYFRKQLMTRYCRSNNGHAFRLPRKGREKRYSNHLINAAVQSSVYGHFIAALIKAFCSANGASETA